MARPGPRPTPTRLRVLHGDEPRRINRDEPQPRVGLVPAAQLDDEMTAEEVELYESTGRELVELGVLTTVDAPVLYQWAAWQAGFRELTRQLRKTGWLVRSQRTGQPVTNPLAYHRRICAEQARACAAELGLSPAARVSLHVDKPDERDERDRLLS